MVAEADDREQRIDETLTVYFREQSRSDAVRAFLGLRDFRVFEDFLKEHGAS